MDDSDDRRVLLKTLFTVTFQALFENLGFYVSKSSMLTIRSLHVFIWLSYPFDDCIEKGVVKL